MPPPLLPAKNYLGISLCYRSGNQLNYFAFGQKADAGQSILKGAEVAIRLYLRIAELLFSICAINPRIMAR